MDASIDEETDVDLLVEIVRRFPAFTALEMGPTNKRHLAESIGVSEATAHRILASFVDAGFAERTDEGVIVTTLGREVARVAERYRTGVDAAFRLEPFLSTIDTAAVQFDVEAFSDATVTVAGPGDPYRPVRRFGELIGKTGTLRGFDTTSLAPTFVDEIHERIADGMRTEIVYEPEIAERIASHYEEFTADVLDRDNVVVHVRDDLPFGLALFDDRVGVGGYDADTGLLQTFADTDDPAAIEWGERLFERYRDEATPL